MGTKLIVPPQHLGLNLLRRYSGQRNRNEMKLQIKSGPGTSVVKTIHSYPNSRTGDQVLPPALDAQINKSFHVGENRFYFAYPELFFGRPVFRKSIASCMKTTLKRMMIGHLTEYREYCE